MKGDFTRSTFRSEKHYSGVRMQQGRVQLDADWNEQIDITAHCNETEAIDVIGSCGAPMHDAGFSLTCGCIPKIGQGRYYVDGILCENEVEDVALDKQTDLPVATLSDLITPKNGTVQEGLYLAYLDVWQRHITALEDDAIREVALGGPDTATRTKTLWQVKLLGPFPAPLTCVSEPVLWMDLLDSTQNGKLSARAEERAGANGPCVVPPGAGYRRLENQLYRVEIHEVDAGGAIKLLKWSRDNGSIVTRWLDQKLSKPSELIVSSIGRDGVLGFGPGQYVEVVDDARELRGEAGILVKLTNAEGQVLTLDTTDPNAATVLKANFPDKIAGRPNNPKVRRWDGAQAPVAGWFELEDGVQIKFEAGEYHVGDYWLIPARTATADVEWPRDTANPPNPIPQPRAGIEHHYCRLAILGRDATGFTVVQDCRELFPPLTELTTLLYVGGDGQEAMPGNPLPQTLRVRVVNGQAPVIGARVQFAVKLGGGSLSVAQPVVTAGPNGIAECGWTLGGTGAQQVEAVLLDAGGSAVPGQILRFSADLSIANQVAYDPAQCSNLATAKTVQDAIDILCKVRRGGCCVCVGKGGDYERLDKALKDLINRGERDICICLIHGDHEVGGMEIAAKSGDRDLHIEIVGCGPGSRVTLHGPIEFSNVNSVVWRDLAIETAFTADRGLSALAFDHCAEVSLRACHLSGFTDDGALLSIANGDRVRLDGNVFEALLPGSLAPTHQDFEAIAREPGVNVLAVLYSQPLRRSEFRQTALKVAEKLAALDVGTREKAQKALKALAISEQHAIRSPGEKISYFKLAIALGAKVMTPDTAFDLLLDIRRTALKTRPGTAIVLERPRRVLDTAGWPALLPVVDVIDQDDLCLVENNDIAGVLSLYGLPAPIDFVDRLLNIDKLNKLSGLLKKNLIKFGFLGTLQMRGNQLVRVAVGRVIVEELAKAAEAPYTFAFDLFGRCQWGDNVFKGGGSCLVCRHLTLHANEFTQFAQPQGTPERRSASLPAVAGTLIADSSIYVANHGSGNVTLRNISRLMEQAANQEITFQ